LYLDCFAGISGDMALGALIDAGAEEDFIRSGIDALGLTGYELKIKEDVTYNIRARRVSISTTGEQPHRHLADIINLIENAGLPVEVRVQASEVFKRLADAEARVHGTTPDKIHFHEVGAVDSICDIVGTLLAIYSLKVDKILCSPLPLGRGSVQCAHGVLPLPAPAALELLKGVPTRETKIEGETVTPTGAALAAVLSSEFTYFPAIKVEKIGYGMGARDYGFPNILRAVIGNEVVEKVNQRATGVYWREVRHEPSEHNAWHEIKRRSELHGLGISEEVIVLEASIDDLNPEFYPYIMQRLLDTGALDAFLTPIIMKGGRPGVLLTVLALPAKWEKAVEIIFTETSTLGIRVRVDRRRAALRETRRVQTEFGEVAVKFAYIKDERGKAPLSHGREKGEGRKADNVSKKERFTERPFLQVSPEYRDCAEIARRKGVPVKKVYNAALKAALKFETQI